MISATGTLPVDAFVFDIDGVLVDSEPLHTRATRLLLAECGVDWDEEDSAECIGLTDVESVAAPEARQGIGAEMARGKPSLDVVVLGYVDLAQPAARGQAQ